MLKLRVRDGIRVDTMTRSSVRYALGVAAAAALLTACSGSPSPIGAPGTAQQRSAIVTHAERGVADARGGDLLYVSGASTGDVYVFSYPTGKLVQTLTGLQYPLGECSDSNGNVFITSGEGQEVITEYAHGATSPTAILTGAGTGEGCAVDPTSGDVAAPSSPGTLAIWGSNPSSPTIYKNRWGALMSFCGYDKDGNLFVDATSDPTSLYELPADKSAFKRFAIKQVSIDTPGQVQWDGTHITIQDRKKRGAIYRFRFSGNAVYWTGTTQLGGSKSTGLSWIQTNQVIVPFAVRRDAQTRLGYWAYPSGGKAKLVLSNFHFPRYFEAATVSVAR